MEWDSLGAFALFISAGGVGLGLVWLSAYKAQLRAKLEHSQLHSSADESVSEFRQEVQDTLDAQAAQIAELHERLDFAERLLVSQGRVDEEGAE